MLVGRVGRRRRRAVHAAPLEVDRERGDHAAIKEDTYVKLLQIKSCQNSLRVDLLRAADVGDGDAPVDGGNRGDLPEVGSAHAVVVTLMKIGLSYL